MVHTTAPRTDYARPELRALLAQGMDPLMAWLRTLPDAPGFHTTSPWENVLACYLSQGLPGLPPESQWQQDVLVICHPAYEENDAYNRIFTQYSGNCLIPDDFHAFLQAITRAFGTRFIAVRELLAWLEQGQGPEQARAPQQQFKEDTSR